MINVASNKTGTEKTADKMTQDLNNNNVVPANTKPAIVTNGNASKPPRKQHRNGNSNSGDATTNGESSQHGGSGSTNNHNSNNSNGNSNNTQTMKVGKDAVEGLANEKSLLDLMERTGYQLTHHNGQRKFGPPPNFTGAIPSRGCEVFIGKLPRDCYEDELVPVFEKVGKIYELRLMMDYNGQNRGYAFVVYCNKRDAQKCVRTLNNYEIRKGRLLGVCQSVDNCRLFIGGIPKKVKKDDIMEEISKVTDYVVDVIVYPSATDKSKNRGFAFVEYDSHRSAAMARRKLMNGKIQLWGHPIAVDWAEPEQEVDEEIMDQVKVLYVRNLQLNTTEETIENLFKQFADVERVKKIKDYCFVHFATREGARNALDNMQGQQIDEADVEVTLAKPVDKEHYRQQRAVAKLMQMANQYQQFPSVLPELAAPFNGMPPFHPQMPGGLMYPPMGMQGGQGVRPIARGRGRTAAGSRSAGGRAYVLNGFLPQLHPILQASMAASGQSMIQDSMYDILPGMDLSPTNPVTLKPQGNRSPFQVLEEYCQKNQWGSPIFTLHSTVANDCQLFLYKVTIPALGNTYQPHKLCRSVDEAKMYSAEYTLSQIANDAAASSISPQLSPAPYPVRVGPGNMPPRSVTSESTPHSYPGYVPISTAVGHSVMAKVAWPNGALPPHPNYFDFPAGGNETRHDYQQTPPPPHTQYNQQY